MYTRFVKLWKILAIVLLIGTGVFVFQKSRQEEYKNFPPQATGDWVAFGDSLTAGTGAPQGADYPTVLSQKIGRPIHNREVPGETTQHALNRVGTIAQLRPRVVLLCFGGNDGLQQLPADKTFANLSAIIDELHAAGSFVVLIGVRSASVSDRYAKLFKNLADEKNVLFVPNILKGVLGTPSLMSDYIHPNEEGYKAIAVRLEKALAPVLAEL